MIQKRALPGGQKADVVSMDFKTCFLRLAPALKHQTFLASLGLFLLAFLPRAYDLQRFVTADEAKWVYRSAQFLAALLRADLAATSVNLTPAVTTTWLGSLGLSVYYWLHRASLGQSLVDWLAGLPEFRVELDVLAAARWPMVWLTSLAVVAVYLLARRLFRPGLAFLAAALFALDPHPVSLSRILGHDAPAAVFMSLSLLLLLRMLAPSEQSAGVLPSPPAPFPQGEGSRASDGVRVYRWAPLILSGAAAGLAFLSKAPALFLIPFAGLLFLGQTWRRSLSLLAAGKLLAVWVIAAYLTFVVAWPAAWLEPLGRPLAVVENAFLSATDQEEADAEGYWLTPDLGPAYYLVNGGFKLSPLVSIGLVLALVWGVRTAFRAAGPAGTGPVSFPLLALLAFAVLFTLFMTLGDKRSPRYILPAFPPLAFVAAAGWLWLFRLFYRDPAADSGAPAPGARFVLPAAFYAFLVACALLVLLPYGPYYFTYYNPLLGGPFTASRLVKIGWGEGLDRVGRFLQREEFRNSRVGTAYASTVAPFFEGDLAAVTGQQLDFLVLYVKQVQSGQPSPTFIRYFEYFGPIFSVDLNGIHYADVYPGPALQPALALTPGLDHAILPKPTGFRPLTPYGHIGEPLEVDVVWLADEPLPADPSTVTLEPLAAFDFLSEDNHADGTARVRREITVLARGQGLLTRLADNLVASRHRLELPDSLDPGRYALLVDRRPLGEIELRRFRPPAELQPVDKTVFGQQISLVGYRLEPGADFVRLTIAWQAQQSGLPDYTVFVQLLDADNNERVAGLDLQPRGGEWPTSRWARGEVVVEEYLLAIPPDIRPGFYHLIAGLYRPENGRRLALADGRDFWLVPWTFMWEER